MISSGTTGAASSAAHFDLQATLHLLLLLPLSPLLQD
jgi:hypothetical protein